MPCFFHPGLSNQLYNKLQSLATGSERWHQGEDNKEPSGRRELLLWESLYHAGLGLSTFNAVVNFIPSVTSCIVTRDRIPGIKGAGESVILSPTWCWGYSHSPPFTSSFRVSLQEPKLISRQVLCMCTCWWDSVVRWAARMFVSPPLNPFSSSSLYLSYFSLQLSPLHYFLLTVSPCHSSFWPDHTMVPSPSNVTISPLNWLI